MTIVVTTGSRRVIEFDMTLDDFLENMEEGGLIRGGSMYDGGPVVLVNTLTISEAWEKPDGD